MSARIARLSDEQLRSELISAGLTCGPVTGTTRKLYEKRLLEATAGKNTAPPSSAKKGRPSTVASRKSPPRSSARRATSASTSARKPSPSPPRSQAYNNRQPSPSPPRIRPTYLEEGERSTYARISTGGYRDVANSANTSYGSRTSGSSVPPSPLLPGGVLPAGSEDDSDDDHGYSWVSPAAKPTAPSNSEYKSVLDRRPTPPRRDVLEFQSPRVVYGGSAAAAVGPGPTTTSTVTMKRFGVDGGSSGGGYLSGLSRPTGLGSGRNDDYLARFKAKYYPSRRENESDDEIYGAKDRVVARGGPSSYFFQAPPPLQPDRRGTGAAWIPAFVKSKLPQILAVSSCVFVVFLVVLYVGTTYRQQSVRLVRALTGAVADAALALVIAAIIIGIFGVLYLLKMRRDNVRTKNAKELRDMIRAITDYVRQHQARSGDDAPIPVPAVRDAIIAPEERQRQLPVWNRAVAWLRQNESRLLTESAGWRGEETLLWRWNGDLAPPPTHLPDPRHPMWQGSALSVDQRSRNGPTVLLSECLKLRNIFDEQDAADPYEMEEIKRAILRKLGPSGQVVHVQFDTRTKDGTTYLKCLSPEAAAYAYKALHGHWFNKKMINAKYVTLERYTERFPDSAWLTRVIS